MRAVRSRIKTSMMLVLVALSLGLPGTGAAALSTGDLIRLKSSGLSDNTIQLIVDSGYSNIDRVIKLKEAGFKDETIASVVRGDLKEAGAASAPTMRSGTGAASDAVKEGAAPPKPITRSGTDAAGEVVNFETKARVRIERYLATSGDGLLTNDVEIDAAMVSIVNDKTLKLDFPKNSGGYGGYILRLAEFKSPFYWDVNKDDTVTPDPRKNIYVLKSTKFHAGRPQADGSHYWVISFAPAKPEFAEWIARARIAN
jgi:hypothetical protein